MKINYSKKYSNGFTHELIERNLLQDVKTIKLVRGFTLVESLVAISIFVIAVAGTLNAIQGGIQKSTMAKENMTAFYLAQEGMEFIKNKRDNNALFNLNGPLTPVDWLEGLVKVGASSGPCDFGKVCQIDSVYSPQIANCSSGTCANLTTETNTGLYTQHAVASGYVDSKFKRELRFQNIPGTTEEVMATITISWTSRGTVRSFVVSETFFNR